MRPSEEKSCNYLGHLKNSLSSSVAVTGCMKKPGDEIEITMITDHSGIKLYTVDFYGNKKAIEIPPNAIKTKGKRN